MFCNIVFRSCSSAAPEERGKLSLLVSCETVFDNLDLISEDQLKILPADGIIFHHVSVDFTEGDSVYDILVEQLQSNRIQFQADSTFGFIEGIANLYNGDAGDLSGWFYKVNGVFPDKGTKTYIPADGDLIEFLYSCDFGIDLGMIYE